MARPRVFVSSTYFDLKHIRASIEGFISELGYDPVLFESGDIAFSPDATLDESCYAEVKNSHMLVLIIGGRYGSAADGSSTPPRDADAIQKMYHRYNSVTRQEYVTARENDIPIFLFVEKQVRAEYDTFKANRNNDSVKYAHVDNISVFHLLDEILEQKRGNYIKSFERFEDISFWLREQWAGIFADMLARKRNESALEDMAHNLRRLNELTTTLKDYSVSIAKKIVPDETDELQKKGLRRRSLYAKERFHRTEFYSGLCRALRKLGFIYPDDALRDQFHASENFKVFVHTLHLTPAQSHVLMNSGLEELFVQAKQLLDSQSSGEESVASSPE